MKTTTPKSLGAVLFVAALVAGLIPSRSQADLVARWAFDESGGTNAYPSVGSTIGFLTGTAQFAPAAGVSGGAVHLDETRTNYVNFGDVFNFTGASFSLHIWILMNAGDTHPGFPLSRHQSGFVNGYFIAVNDVSDGLGGAVNHAHFYAAGAMTAPSAVTVNDGQWHQLVATYNSTNGTSFLYVDGAFQSSVFHAPGRNDVAVFEAGGVCGGGGPAGGFIGLLDEARVYDHALSAAEVLALYHQLLPVTLALQRGGPLVTLWWLSQPDVTYQLQMRTNLSNSTSWGNLGLPVPGDGTIKSLPDLFGGSQRYYRLVKSL